MPSGRELSARQTEKLFRAWFECQSVRVTARKCHVSDATVKKYMKERGWHKRRDDILAKAQKAGDDKTAFTINRELQITNGFIGHVAAIIIARLGHKVKCSSCQGSGRVKEIVCAECGGKGVVYAMQVSMTDYVKLVELKDQLLDKYEPEVPVLPEGDRVTDLLNCLTDDAMKKLAEAAITELTKPDDDQS
ncbi:hypothetical protein M0R72_07950 [Candidatus Pacearchaeota archaeon]|jgi:hypothetical protein|nr:hypothetical protein [Candidatus Pacearchaeota archaeon]